MREKQPVIIVGSGKQGENHLKTWPRAGAEVVSVVDIDEERATAVARRFGIGSWFTSLEAALEKAPQLVIVDIVTPPQPHKDLILATLEAGAPVLVEKPMVLTLEELEDVKKAAQRSTSPVCVMHNFLFEPVTRKAAQLVRRGALGDLCHVHAEVLSTPRDPMIGDSSHWVHALPGGRIEEALPHVCYMLFAFLGLELEGAGAKAAKLIPGYPWVKFDTLTGMVRAKSAVGSFHMSFAGGTESTTLDLIGTKGAARVYLYEKVLERSYISYPSTRLKLARAVMGQTRERIAALISNSVRFATRTYVPATLHVMRELVRAVQTGSPPPVSLAEAGSTVLMTQRIIGSALMTDDQ